LKGSVFFKGEEEPYSVKLDDVTVVKESDQFETKSTERNNYDSLVIGVKVEEVAATEEEWDPQPSTSGTITTESENCMAVLGDGCGSCTGTCQASSGDGNHFVFVNAEEFVDMEVEVVPKPITSAVIQPEPTSCVDLLRNYPGSHSENHSHCSANISQTMF
jgi:hypothetical protein